MPSKSLKTILSVALGLLLSACASSEHNPSTLMRVAQNMEKMDKTSEALDLYTQLLIKEPKNDEAFQQALRLARSVGNREVVLEILTHRLAAYPDETETLLEQGKACIAAQNLSCARQAYDRVLSQDSQHFSARFGRAVIEDLSGHHQAAQSRYEALLQEAPQRHEVYANYGLSLALSGQPGAALPYLKKAAESPQASNKDRANLATALAMAGQKKEAIQLFNQEVGPQAAQQNLRIVEAFMKTLGNHASAGERQESAGELNAIIPAAVGEETQGVAHHAEPSALSHEPRTALPMNTKKQVSSPTQKTQAKNSKPTRKATKKPSKAPSSSRTASSTPKRKAVGASPRPMANPGAPTAPKAAEPQQTDPTSEDSPKTTDSKVISA
ncbi:MAG: hypothetical protein ACK5O7_04215 [Holosporales bacterium]